MGLLRQTYESDHFCLTIEDNIVFECGNVKQIFEKPQNHFLKALPRMIPII